MKMISKLFTVKKTNAYILKISLSTLNKSMLLCYFYDVVLKSFNTKRTSS